MQNATTKEIVKQAVNICLFTIRSPASGPRLTEQCLSTVKAYENVSFKPLDYP